MVITKDKSFYKSLVLLALPISLQSLVTFLVGLADNVMIGTLGDVAVSGVYMGGQIQTLLQIVTMGIEGAILVLSAQYWGRGDKRSIGKIASIGIRISFILGLVLNLVCAIFPSFVISLFTSDAEIISTGAEYLSITAFSFTFFSVTQAMIASMRSVEVAKVGLYVSGISLAANVALNYLLIFGALGLPALGVKGAAIATLISRILETAIISVYVFLIDKRLGFSPKELLRLDKTLLLDFIKYGAPIVAAELVWAVNMLSNSAIMGRQSADGVVAALSIANAMNNLTYVATNGMAGAISIITGKTVGEGKEELMREYAKTVQLIFLGIGILTGLTVFLLKGPFISIYGVSEAAKSQANALITVLSITSVGSAYQATGLLGMVKSGGDVSFVFKNDLFFVTCVVIPSALVATYLGAPPFIVFACLKCDQILKCIVAAIKINKFNWMKNLTRDIKA